MYRIEYGSMHMICSFYGKYGHYVVECAKKGKVEEIGCMEESVKDYTRKGVITKQKLVYRKWMLAQKS